MGSSQAAEPNRPRITSDMTRPIRLSIRNQVVAATTMAPAR